MRAPLFLPALALALAANAQNPDIRVYFNQSTDPTVSSGVYAITLGPATDDTIQAYIDRAQYTVDVAMYNADDYSIMYALNHAKERGVQVRYIAEGTNTNSGLASLDSSIPVLFRTDGQGSGMHNKFMSIDADHADLAWVWTGSVNWTQGGLFHDFNNMVFLHSQALAQAYRTEFEEMWGGSGPQPDQANSRFGSHKTDNTPHSFTIGGVQVECYFSPSDHTTSHIVQAIQAADQTIRTALYSFTNDDLGNALLAAHQSGVTVQMDLEDPLTSGSEGYYLYTHGITDIATHNTDNVLLHHKYAIIDEGTASDPVVITGSHNWTWNAETVNDENLLVIHDATIANLFYQEWHARRSSVAGLQEFEEEEHLSLFPMPAADVMHVQMPRADGAVTLTVLDALGRVVLRSAEPTTPVIDLDVRSLPTGPYTLMVTSGTRVLRQRFQVAR